MKIFIRNICIIMTIWLSGIATANGETFTVDYPQVRLTYEITSDTTVSVVWMDVLDTVNDIDLRIPESAENNGISYTVTGFWYDNDENLPASWFDYEEGIWKYAADYYDQKYGNIRSLTFPSTLTTMQRPTSDYYSHIELRGFIGLRKITIENAEVYVPRLGTPRHVVEGSGTTTVYISNIEEIDFGNSVIEIGGIRGGFWGGIKLQKIRLPKDCVIRDGAFYYCTSLTEVEWIEKDNERVDEYGDRCGGIGSTAFFGCTSLKEIEIPRNIESMAFSGCTALEKVMLTEPEIDIWERAFYGCTALKEIDLTNCKLIRDNAFRDCTSLQKVYFSEQLKDIGKYVFFGCKDLEEIILDSTGIPTSGSGLRRMIFTVDDGVLYGAWFSPSEGSISDCRLCVYPTGKKTLNFEIPKIRFGNDNNEYKVDEIAGGAFAGNKHLEKITLSSTQLKNPKTFEGCESLKEVVLLPGDTQRLPFSSFKDCPSLENVTLPDNYIMIGHSVFEGCKSLKDITLPNELMGIYDAAFTDCTALNEITLPENLAEIGISSFRGCTALKKVDIPSSSRLASIGSAAFEECKSLKSISLPEALDSIGMCAFRNCTALSEIHIPDNVKTIRRQAFENCTGAKSVRIGNGIREIDLFTFYGCSGATRLEIGENVSTVCNDAFGGMDALREIICHPVTPPDYPSGFSEEVKENAELIVPEGSGNAYHSDITWQPFILSEAGIEIISTDAIQLTRQGVKAPDGMRTDIYSLTGQLVGSGIGSFELSLSPGIYIIHAPGIVSKISVK
ncbi:MAG: leucine-rich repeat domain-containing protein [Muribaculaceae bacterium]|nr:leucine-rich repeat domain-containing protein [Muribaculaceae bacterium]